VQALSIKPLHVYEASTAYLQNQGASVFKLLLSAQCVCSSPSLLPSKPSLQLDSCVEQHAALPLSSGLLHSPQALHVQDRLVSFHQRSLVLAHARISAPVFLNRYGRVSADLQVTRFSRKLHNSLRHDAAPPFLDAHSRFATANIIQALRVRFSATTHAH
jgi:hypothetical protein